MLDEGVVKITRRSRFKKVRNELDEEGERPVRRASRFCTDF
jgi:hypothetical protein